MRKNQNMFSRSIHLTLVILVGSFSSLNAEDPQITEEIDEYMELMTQLTYKTTTKPERGRVSECKAVSPMRGFPKAMGM